MELQSMIFDCKLISSGQVLIVVTIVYLALNHYKDGSIKFLTKSIIVKKFILLYPQNTIDFEHL